MCFGTIAIVTAVPTETLRKVGIISLPVALLLLAARPAQAQNPLDELILEPFITGLDKPTTVIQTVDGSGRLFVTLQEGQIVIHDGAQTLPAPFLDITSQVGCCGETGLLGMAFHPDFEQNGYFYVFYTDKTDPIRTSILSRFRVSADDPNRADPAAEKILMRIGQGNNNHQAGQLHFGPDGYLYIAVGDGGLDPRLDDPAQRLNSLLGKILRIDVDRGDPYAIPPDNPFAGRDDAAGEIWLYGLRNPWRFSFDRETGDMFIGDVGSSLVEEINFLAAGAPAGGNYGWAVREGDDCLFGNPRCGEVGLVPPLLFYRHSPEPLPPEVDPCAIVGGYRYRGVQMPQFRGRYFYGDFCNGFLYGATHDGASWNANEPRDTDHYFSTFGEDADGELYVADWVGGGVYRLSAPRPTPQLTTLTPGISVEGADEFVLAVAGSLFVPDSEVWWNGEARPTQFVDNGLLRVSISAEDVAEAGAARISVFNPRPGGGLSESVEFTIASLPDDGPAVAPEGIVSAASFLPGRALAPGSIISVFGANLAVQSESAAGAPLPTSLGGSSARFDDEFQAPYFFASAGQLNIQIPWDLEGKRMSSLRVRVGSVAREGVAVPLRRFSPAIFTLDQSGSGQGAVLIAGSGGMPAGPASLPGASRPAQPGDFLEVFCTGLGPVERGPQTGYPAGRSINPTINPATATIGGVDAAVTFSGLAPGFVGLYQVNVQVPEEVTPGENVELSIAVRGVGSNRVTIAVE